MINRRLYLESPTEIQRLLIVLYELGTIGSYTIETIVCTISERKTITASHIETVQQ